MRRPAALLVDLDGTLIDSREDIAAACNAALAAHGVKTIEPPSRIFAMVGDGAKKLVERALAAAGAAGADADRVRETFEARYAAHPCERTVVIDGARELLACGVPCAVLTNKPRAITTRVLDALDLSRSLAGLWAGDGPLKPSPDGVLALCEALAVSPRDAWMVGDGPQDVGAGRAAGAFTVGVPGIAAREALEAASPDLLLPSLRDVLRAVTSAAP